MDSSAPIVRTTSAPTPTPGFVDPTSQFDLEFKNVIGTGYITAKPTPV